MTALTPAETFGRIPGVDLRRERIRVRVEPCACGSEVIAEADQATWTEAVARHNAGWAHTLWWVRVRHEWQGGEP